MYRLIAIAALLILAYFFITGAVDQALAILRSTFCWMFPSC